MNCCWESPSLFEPNHFVSLISQIAGEIFLSSIIMSVVELLNISLPYMQAEFESWRRASPTMISSIVVQRALFRWKRLLNWNSASFKNDYLSVCLAIKEDLIETNFSVLVVAAITPSAVVFMLRELPVHQYFTWLFCCTLSSPFTKAWTFHISGGYLPRTNLILLMFCQEIPSRSLSEKFCFGSLAFSKAKICVWNISKLTELSFSFIHELSMCVGLVFLVFWVFLFVCLLVFCNHSF